MDDSYQQGEIADAIGARERDPRCPNVVLGTNERCILEEGHPAGCRPSALTELREALAEISELFDGGGWEDADADELRGDVERVIAIVNRVVPRSEIEAAQEADDAG